MAMPKRRRCNDTTAFVDNRALSWLPADLRRDLQTRRRCAIDCAVGIEKKKGEWSAAQLPGVATRTRHFFEQLFHTPGATVASRFLRRLRSWTSSIC
jgi:hypothetical protein